MYILQYISTQEKSTHSEMPSFPVMSIQIKTGSVYIQLKKPLAANRPYLDNLYFSMKRDS